MREHIDTGFEAAIERPGSDRMGDGEQRRSWAPSTSARSVGLPRADTSVASSPSMMCTLRRIVTASSSSS
ncbi:hypothetical protein [Brevibacterium linens]|uniref:hypothetical protein n=1 Tax=Brevibacterium linens TaxID=1703 RepID=UPI003F8A372A